MEVEFEGTQYFVNIVIIIRYYRNTPTGTYHSIIITPDLHFIEQESILILLWEVRYVQNTYGVLV